MIFRWLKWLFVVVCGLLLSLYIARQPLSTKLANHYLQPYNLQLSCLDWSFGSWRAIHIESLCLTAETFAVNLRDINATRSDVYISQLDARLKQTQQSQQPMRFTPLALPLPNRPLLHIEHISIEGAPWGGQINASLTERKANHFSLLGDVIADVHVQPSEVQANVDLQSPLLQGLLPDFVTSFTGDADVVFQGEHATVSVAPKLAANIPNQGCQLPLQSTGTIQLNVALNSQKVITDASGLTTTFTPQECDTLLPKNYREQLEVLVGEPWTLALSTPINFQDGRIETQEVLLRTNAQSSVLVLQKLQAQIQDKQFKSELTFAHNTKLLGEASLDGTLRYQNSELYIDSQLMYQSEHLPFVAFEHQNSQLEGSVKLVMGPAVRTLSLVAKGGIESASVSGVEISSGQLDIEGALGFTDTLSGEARAKITAPALKFTDGHSKHNRLEVNAKLSADQQLTLDSELNVDKVTHTDKQLSGLTSKFTVSSDLTHGEIFSALSGQTRLAQLQLPKLAINDIHIDSKVQQSRGGAFEHYIQAAGMEGVLKHQYSPQAHPYQLVVSAKPVTKLQPILAQLIPQLQLSEGNVSIVANGDLNLQTGDFKAQFDAVSALYDTHYIDDINTQISGQFSSGKINIADSKVTVGQVRSGVVLTNVSAQLQVEDNLAQLHDLTAQVFDGQVHLALLKLSSAPQQLQLKAQALDLALLAQAGRDAGVELSGRVSGIFPVRIENGTVSIEQGKLFNAGVGNLKVAQNASIEALKTQQPSLESVIGVLDDLTIDTLSSDVVLTSDGWLTLGVQIVGENKAQAQPVNFNYTHQENIFTLFRALRLSDEITQKVEDALTKQEQSP
ncbi:MULTISPECIES: intermembrane phospholipid transport protein YdbH family protein [Pseudoalteromonas]|uniref:Uncharacterized protein n=1 Tax=Pseudoalteromonas amylolytica TaxID=1859457 RepID=A0A1S1MYN1_9GAMM|nr:MULTISPECIES: YdbH domain-containing protein [Pseudoalteromonas]OHU89237.1 hypothetical protein BFC16_06255 [Pseudoalteromonas sp. JW3]OHU92137.1 hypothetical protein BET10_07360 [Pseudoalteromonas amylolytica]